MAFLDPQQAHQHFQDKVLDGIRATFPVKGKLQSVHLEGLEVKDNLKHDDFNSQYDAKVGDKSWAVPVYATLTLTNNSDGAVVDRRRVRVADIPKITNRHSYIVEGQEYQIDNQWQLKPGVYARRKKNGELEARFNVVGKPTFNVHFDPPTKQFVFDYNKSKLPLLPFLQAQGIEKAQLEAVWGKEILAANEKMRGSAGAVDRWFKSVTKREPTAGEASQFLAQTFQASTLRPDSTKLTLGKEYTHVTGEALVDASRRVLEVHRGGPEDDRDSLLFKDIRSGGDFVFDKFRNAQRTVQTKIQRKLGTATDLRKVVRLDHFQAPIRSTFIDNAATRVANQINPVEMLAAASQTTVLGPGGIQSEQKVTEQAKYINPSHFGFLDPCVTPESSRTGITLRLPLGVERVGNQLGIAVHDLKTGQPTHISAQDFYKANVVLADQVNWKNGKPVPKSAKVHTAINGNEFAEKPFSEARYVMSNPSQAFSLTTNLIPFLPNTNGNRASMSARHIEQAISLKDREAPLVQVATGSSAAGAHTFEGVMGKWSAQVAPVSGEVTKVGKNGITVRDASGQSHTVATYHNYPLNDAKSLLHSESLVKAGDKVKKDQVLADTNYSKDGVLAQGTNLRIGYIPFKGLNYEDAFVISESAAKKLSSHHLHKHEVNITPDLVLSRRKFEVEHPAAFSKKQIETIGQDGIVPVGTKVKPGDPLVLAMTPFQIKDRVGLNQIRRSVSGAHTDRSLRWEGETEGEVVAVHQTSKGVKVHVKTVEPMRIADKLSSRSANKGVVGAIIPDHEMPRTADGQHIEIAMNPLGLGGRGNLNQIYETLASKIAKKTGKPYVVQNFGSTDNMLGKIKSELAQHGLSDNEELYDPVTKQKMGPALVGYQHMLKLTHQVDKKTAVRSGMELPGLHSGESYDVNLQPGKGGHAGGQSIGSLGMYALLSHGVPNVIREIQTLKSEGPDPQTNEGKRWPSQHMATWQAIQTGAPIPTPKPTFAFAKFIDMLKGSGVNVEKEGHEYILSPLTNKHILSMSAGALPKPTLTVHAKLKDGELMPENGGLFDPKLTGGHGGRKFNHIELAEPVPNPVFESPIVSLLGMKRTDYHDIVSGKQAISTVTHTITTPDKGLVGGQAIAHLLDRIDVKKELKTTRAKLDSTPIHKVDPLVKKMKYLRTLDKLGMKPSEAYVLKNVPVIPAVMRPVSLLPQGDVKRADINELYVQLAMVNDELKNKKLQDNLPDAARQQLRSDHYAAVRAIAGVGVPYADQQHKGLLHQIAGPFPKAGFVQKTLLSKKQDLTMRGVITPGQDLGLDEVGLPRKTATTLFRPFLVKKLVEHGEAQNPLAAQKLLAQAEKGEKVPAVNRALDAVAAERPVMMKRDPALHKFSVMGFTPRIHDGPDIKMHPLVTAGLGADFDGDTVSVYVPIGRDAVDEVHKMKPSNNLFAESTGRLMNTPSLDSAFGLYKLSVTNKKPSGHTFDHYAAALQGVKDGKVHINDLVHIKDRGFDTTPGRILLATGLPEKMHQAVLKDHHVVWDKKGMTAAFTQIAKEHKNDFALHANRLKDIGNGASFGAVGVLPSDTMGIKALDPKNQYYVPTGVSSYNLKDFESDHKARDKHLATARTAVDKINAGSGTKSEKDAKSIAHWQHAEMQIKADHIKQMEHTGSTLYSMYKAGTKPSWDQYKQITIAPMLVNDSEDRPIANPVVKSYSEGLNMAGYWQQMYGARRGTAKKVLEVQGPGALTKLLMSNTIDSVVSNHSCGTTKGISMSVHSPDVTDRYLATAVKGGGLDLKAGTLLSSDIVGKLRGTNHGHVSVRSALKCEEPKGLCQICLGKSVTGHDHKIGDNVGVGATQTLGERSVQLTLRAFHSSGMAGASGLADASAFKRLEQLTKLPEVVPGAATLAMKSGKIERVEKDVTGAKIWVSGVPHHVGLDRFGAGLHTELAGPVPNWTAPKVGQHVDAGHSLSDPTRTVVNPRDLYEATGSMEKVQNHLTDQIHNLYASEGVKRKNVEILVKSMSNLTRIHDPGDHPDLLRGEFRPTSIVERLNKELRARKQAPIQHTPVLKGVELLPHDMQEDWMAKLMHKRLRTTIENAAATMGRADTHSNHPIPSLLVGSEFGLNTTQSNKPGMGHLKDVPKHHY